jgi:hypothetical protein
MLLTVLLASSTMLDTIAYVSSAYQAYEARLFIFLHSALYFSVLVVRTLNLIVFAPGSGGVVVAAADQR